MSIHPTIVETRTFGNVLINLQYVDEEPALVVRSKRFLNQRRSAWVIMMDVAWKYVSTETGDHTPYMVDASRKIAEQLGLGNDVKTRFGIAEAIHSCLEDLINMKPYQHPEDAVAADVEGVMRVGDLVIPVSAQIDQPVNATGEDDG